MRVRLYKLSERLMHRFLPASIMLHSLVWLQLLRPRDLEEITRQSYSGREGDSFASREHNSSGLWPWEQSMCDEALAQHSSILIVGAGAGREMIALAKLGHSVVGIEPAQHLVAAGKKNLCAAGIKADLLLASPSRLPEDLGRFDALMIGRGVYHHIPRSRRRIELLRACRRHLKPCSPLIMGDFLTRPNSDFGWGTALMIFSERGDFLRGSFFHKFSLQEIRSELELAGFEIVCYRETPLNWASNHAHCLARSAD